MVKSGELSILSVIVIFAVVAIVEELAPASLEVWLTVVSAHSALSGSARTQAFEQDNLALLPASAA